MSLLPLSRRHIDLAALARNVRALKGLTAPGTAFMAVVKADAYGHGAIPAARTVLEAGATHLAVARISEAAALRDAGIKAPTLLFGEADPDQAAWLAGHDIRASVPDPEAAERLARGARSQGACLKVHIKVDSGMGRLGLVLGGAQGTLAATADAVQHIHTLEGLEVEGLYTHLARADETDLDPARDQVARFSALIRELETRNIRPPFCHAANSAGLIALPQSHLDMVRPGISLYGLWPSGDMDRSRVDLSPVMAIRSGIIQVKSVPAGFAVSYGGTHVTPAPTIIATVPVGYADGYSRLLSNRGAMLVRGQKAPILGRVCMDFTMIDVGQIPGAAPGDEVVVLGPQGEASVTADDIAALTNTINYEVTAGLTARMPLTYTPAGTVS